MAVDQQFISDVKALVEARCKPGARSKAEARALLISEGIIGSDGRLTPEYGGPSPVFHAKPATDAAPTPEEN
ncbi:hypothetical protein [Bosea lathyri]|uniref:Uncharacterized protein n=1 Tax=Bosea lathyri TaxID=1036778 RepID=A0A1H6BV51_9HYPH|nr:hypothetical protein [Bosea lathyri]SEG64549.1 hypothetical protein SAMN04488115_108105 [Bosea lathyri]